MQLTVQNNYAGLQVNIQELKSGRCYCLEGQREPDEKEKYDGIWACASILHLPKKQLREVLKNMYAALISKGWIYTSFKYGEFEGERNGRYFTDFTTDTFKDFIHDMHGLKIEEQWITGDVRPGRGEEKWLNLLLQKK